MPPVIRHATIKDRDAICALHVASWQVNYGGEIAPTILKTVLPAEMASKWAARTFLWPELILIAENGAGDGQITGFVCALADRTPPLIDNLHVRPGLQSRGVGAALLNAALVNLAAKGFDTATLEVLEKNRRARDFYIRMGGRDIGKFHGKLMGKKVAERRFIFDLTNR